MDFIILGETNGTILYICWYSWIPCKEMREKCILYGHWPGLYVKALFKGVSSDGS